jgi:chromosome segregation ATPase
VTESDVAALDRAISAHEGLGLFLYTTRRILGELGKLETYHRGLKEGIAVVEQQGVQVNAHLERAKADLAKAQHEEVETRQQLATLSAEVKEKETLLKHYSEAIDRITGKAA